MDSSLEFLILASDGLWDVVTNEVSTNSSRNCILPSDLIVMLKMKNGHFLLTGSRGHGEADSGLRAGRQEAPCGGLAAGQRRQHHLRRRALLGAAQRTGQGNQ